MCFGGGQKQQQQQRQPMYYPYIPQGYGPIQRQYIPAPYYPRQYAGPAIGTQQEQGNPQQKASVGAESVLGVSPMGGGSISALPSDSHMGSVPGAANVLGHEQQQSQQNNTWF